MAIDAPARIAIIGAGPIGLETALYARFLGYEVEIYERGQTLQNVRRWGHVRLFTPWILNVSPLAVAALQAQDSQWRPPPDNALLTGREMVDRYWFPLAQTDLIADQIHEHTTVVSISRANMFKSEHFGDALRGDDDFLLLLRDADGQERLTTADVIIDASGVYGLSGGVGPGGIPAPGETALAGRIEYGLPDVFGEDGRNYAGRRVLIIGAGHSAAANVVALASLDPRPRITWITPNEMLATALGPVEEIAADLLTERSRVVRGANELAASSDRGVTHWAATSVASLAFDVPRATFDVTLSGECSGAIEVDQIVANVGFRPDHSIVEPLQVQFCPATESPVAWAQALRTGETSGSLGLPASSPADLLTTEPNFYILGAKSHGRDGRFLLPIGLRQIRDLFTIIADRTQLDLYKTIR